VNFHNKGKSVKLIYWSNILFCSLFIFGAPASEIEQQQNSNFNLSELNETIKNFSQTLRIVTSDFSQLQNNVQKTLSIIIEVINSQDRKHLETQKKVDELKNQQDEQNKKITGLQAEVSALRGLMEQSFNLREKNKKSKKKRSNSDELERKKKLEKN
jgi:predicted mannosyl-3-phosphoglycerate phosphatase (HAD superfamily)